MGIKEKLVVNMTIEDHLNMAEKLISAKAQLDVLFQYLQRFFSKTELKSLQSLRPGMPGKLSNLTSDLDDQWHVLISGEEFDRYGHIYYAKSAEAVRSQK